MYDEDYVAFLNLMKASKSWGDGVAQHGASTLRKIRKYEQEGSLTIYRFQDGTSMDLCDLVNNRAPTDSDSEEDEEPEMKRPKKIRLRKVIQKSEGLFDSYHWRIFHTSSKPQFPSQSCVMRYATTVVIHSSFLQGKEGRWSAFSFVDLEKL